MSSTQESDIAKLICFLDKTKEQIDYFLKIRAGSYFGETYLRSKTDEEDHNPNLMKILKDAWEETRPRFVELKEHVQSQRSLEKLQSVGLTGEELNLKLTIFYESYDDLLIQEKEFASHEELDERRKGFRLWHRLQKLKEKWEKYLDFTDTILGSLSSAGLPGSDAILEFKETLEKLLKWWRTRKKF